MSRIQVCLKSLPASSLHKKDELNDLKGKYVGCNGFFKPDTWEEDGKKRSRIIFAVTKMEILTMKDNEEAAE